MPRYFFLFEDGHVTPDEIGVELADVEAAQAHAVELAEAVLQDRSVNGRTGPWRVIINRENGDLLGTVTSIRA